MKAVVLRNCIVTREKLEKKDLIRVVKFQDKVFVDLTGKQNGRGCYLKKEKEIILKAKKNKIIDKVLDIKVPDAIYEEILSNLE